VGPVLTALIMAGRLGASMAAEIGSMRITEQIDALRTLSLDPNRYIVMPRIVALAVMMPFLTIFSNVTGTIGAYVVASSFLGITSTVFLDSIQQFFSFNEILGGLLKAFIFGIIIASTGCYMGLQTGRGAQGVGRATIQAFVAAAIAILISDYLLWLILF
jgi:phospholipid/cholesterol/gamma-HCH transport system permease protein